MANPLLVARGVTLATLDVLARTDPRIAALWLQGSLAGGDADAYSDIDAYIAIADDQFDSVWAGRQELLVRLMQTQARQLIFHDYARHLTTHRFAAVVDYIKQHLAESLTIDKLSALACMSKATFFRVFKREFGLTPVEFIIRERLGEAKRLLRHPLASVAEVCLRAGFNNLSYFQALFKKYEGVTPGAYRKQVVA